MKSILKSTALAALTALPALASSHREAPLITSTPKLDCSDFYLFGSYEPGREGYVTLVANYLPLQDAYGGPNYFQLDPDAVYEIHVDNSGDAVEDITFQFRFENQLKGINLVLGPTGNQRTNQIPLLAAGPITAANQGALAVDQSYTLNIIRGKRREGAPVPVMNPKDGSTHFTKPQDNVGNKTFPNYSEYADAYIYEIALPGTDKKGRVFVGQRKDPFVVNLGETFDLINLNPLGAEDANSDSLAYKNVTALCLEVPKEFLLASPEKPILGAWTTASKVTTNGQNAVVYEQRSRLSMPLVNEVVIGVKDKDLFNASEPKDDLQFIDYITHPTLPALINILFSVPAPEPPRADLVAAFATGVTGLNANGSVGEMQRLNTAIAPTARAQQNNMGVIAGFTKGVLDASKADLAGFPNGRRPGDDVVDIALRVVMGKLLTPDKAPIGDAPLTDGATVNARMFPNRFPYLNEPIPGSPNRYVTIGAQTSAAADGPFQNVKPSVDPGTGRVSVQQQGDSQFLRIESDRKLNLTDTKVEAGTLSTKIQ
jgi:hypothetical protein